MPTNILHSWKQYFVVFQDGVIAQAGARGCGAAAARQSHLWSGSAARQLLSLLSGKVNTSSVCAHKNSCGKLDRAITLQ